MFVSSYKSLFKRNPHAFHQTRPDQPVRQDRRITEDGMYIACDEGEVFVPFEKKAELTVESLREEVINVINSMEG